MNIIRSNLLLKSLTRSRDRSIADFCVVIKSLGLVYDYWCVPEICCNTISSYFLLNTPMLLASLIEVGMLFQPPTTLFEKKCRLTSPLYGRYWRFHGSAVSLVTLTASAPAIWNQVELLTREKPCMILKVMIISNLVRLCARLIRPSSVSFSW